MRWLLVATTLLGAPNDGKVIRSFDLGVTARGAVTAEVIDKGGDGDGFHQIATRFRVFGSDGKKRVFLAEVTTCPLADLRIAAGDYADLGRKQIFISAHKYAITTSLLDCDGSKVRKLYRGPAVGVNVFPIRLSSGWRLVEDWDSSNFTGLKAAGRGYLVTGMTVRRTLHWNGRAFVLDEPGPTQAAQKTVLSLDSRPVEIVTDIGEAIDDNKLRLQVSISGPGKGARRTFGIPGPWGGSPSFKMRQPPAMIVHLHGQPYLVTLVREPSGNWGYQSLLLVRATKTGWARVPFDPEITSFSNRGSFVFDLGRLLVWDIAYDEHYAHMAPQRYALREFEVTPAGLRLVRKRLTRKRYKGGDTIGEPHTPPIHDDPLREFRKAWRWWGASR